MGFDWCQDVQKLECVQWHMPVIPVLRRLKQENPQFEASLSNHGNSPSQEKERKEETKSMTKGSARYARTPVLVRLLIVVTDAAWKNNSTEEAFICALKLSVHLGWDSLQFTW